MLARGAGKISARDGSRSASTNAGMEAGMKKHIDGVYVLFINRIDQLCY
jgi:hypothetical protein